MMKRDELSRDVLRMAKLIKRGKKRIEEELQQLKSVKLKRGLKKCEKNRLNRLERAVS